MEANMARSNEKSHMIIENKKRKRLEEIFTCLDSDGDGQISSTKIDIASVGTDVLEAFAPLLCEMEELGQTLTLEDFLEAADKLLKTLTVAERDKLLMIRKNNDSTMLHSDHTFHPNINKRSAYIAEQLKPYGNFDALYDRYLEEEKLKQDKIKEAKARQEEDELRECSFKPQLIANHRIPLVSMQNQAYFEQQGM
mmetsp:Transcript_40886/g.36266  ORF Transcript_40886/g.36266 Transcript_40886/m.36266 type:complete len:196 (-) Transcript_40886:314-901(-)|eukprot:CAMPEP_0114578164 /NCGR_PEP_ID=MMETSP0125-20121206/2736_1 /TAXON_ID=485358 ORGANISM="Aristerostoma sp., Strain ATCC 50986" /NCGR_SAMPLE_ID=MMETSP0125 /ASSEMBLY_ACC=CAM_ASM_000245 /LENGTH=195 /DNA_ID=CAMNT_0001768025 /DNA_START=1395 /DNA_END=1982 /DNA_ORIENTATION=+